jgi:signal peptidase II
VRPASAGVALAVATTGIVVALDQATKQLAIHGLQRGEAVNVFLGLDITNTRNSGVAFGAFQGGGLVVGLLIGLSLGALVGYFAFNAGQPLLWLPVGMLLGGALGNLADRAREGAVIDFIDPVAWPAFNLADASIVLGVLVLFWVLEGRAQPAKPAASHTEGPRGPRR